MQLYRSIDDYLGPGDSRFFGSGFRRAEYEVTDIAVRAGAIPEPEIRAWIGVRYPSDWSTKAERTDLRPHLSSIDVMVLAAQLSEIHLAHAYGLDGSQRRMSWLRKVSLRAGKEPQEDLLRISGSAAPVETGSAQAEPAPGPDGMLVSTYDCAIGVMRARCEIVHPVGRLGPDHAVYLSADDALGPTRVRYFGDGFKARRQVINNVAVDMNDLTASACVQVQPITRTAEIVVPTEGMDGGFQPSFSLVDGFVTSLQLGQVLLYELDSIPREHSNTLWMVRSTVEVAGPRRPYAEPMAARTTITRKRLLPLRGATWRNVDFTSNCGGVSLRASFAHELPVTTGVHR